MDNIRIIKGDITKAEQDAIVNAANPKMLGGGGVDGAIHKAAGPELLEACRKVKPVNGIRCPFGAARITPAGRLKSKYVIHAVGPIYRRNDAPEKNLRSAYFNSCKLALEYGCRSIAFPAISCGAYGYPHEEAAKIALDECGKSDFQGLEIVFYIYEDRLFEIFKRALNEFGNVNLNE